MASFHAKQLDVGALTWSIFVIFLNGMTAPKSEDIFGQVGSDALAMETHGKGIVRFETISIIPRHWRSIAYRPGYARSTL